MGIISANIKPHSRSSLSLIIVSILRFSNSSNISSLSAHEERTLGILSKGQQLYLINVKNHKDLDRKLRKYRKILNKGKGVENIPIVCRSDTIKSLHNKIVYKIKYLKLKFDDVKEKSLLDEETRIVEKS